MSSRITEYQIATAITEIILGLDITPQTTVVAGAAGNDYVDVADASHFTMQTTARFWDLLGEPELAISSVDTSVTPHRIHFESALAHDHLAGAILSTNLFDYAADEIGVGLAKDDPLIIVAPIRALFGWAGTRLASGPVTVQVQVDLLDEQRGVKIHPNLWTKTQQQRAGTLISQIIEEVANNSHLNTNTFGGPIAQGIGDQNGQHLAEMVFDRFISKDNVPVFAAATLIVVRPRPMTLR